MSSGVKPRSARRRLAGVAVASIIERHAVSYRRGSLLGWMSGAFEPLFFLLIVGGGLSASAPAVSVSGVPLSYMMFLAPAMVASSAMNGAVSDGIFAVYYRLRESRLYETMLSTPAEARDVVIGDALWAVIRSGMYCGTFSLSIAVLGLVPSWWFLLAVPAVLALTFAFAGLGMAVTTYVRDWSQLELIPLVTMPIFLLSGTFFPVSVYPVGIIRSLAAASPLYQGVRIARLLAVGRPDWTVAAALAYLVGIGSLGLWWSTRRFEALLHR